MIQNVVQGQLVGTSLKIAIVVSRFNEFITSKLLDGAVDTLSRHGVAKENMVVVWVPGAFEMPFAAAKLVDQQQFDAVICLGAIIRGATPHFDVVVNESAKGLGQLNVKGQTPVINGILTTNTIEQAIERAGTKAGNKGSECATAAIEMANLAHTLSETPVAVG